ncbi:site-2 protease family protein [Actinomyces faecalis]|uniref:site-2 protease family protein n=1 Tax=Actinomyces faecalis TaxID=2722820 RepID=UPI00155480DF|nr:site-2 protease family protein [Actinomyces faecalis]
MSAASRRTGQGLVLGRVGGAPVVVAPTSVLLGLLIAGTWLPAVSRSMSGYHLLAVLGVVAATVLGVALSVLLHELAHGLSGTVLGRRPVRYELYLWGGRTTFGPASTAQGWRPWKDVVTSVAGPAVNLVLWGAGRWLLTTVWLPYPLSILVWALTWVNLALAVFNILPALPLDGGHAVAALIAQVTGRPRTGQVVAAWGGLVVVAGIAWQWLVRPLVLDGQRPDGFSLVLAVMVAWPLAQTSWTLLGLGRGSRAAARLDLRPLVRPVQALPASTPLARVRDALDDGVGLVVVVDGPRLLGTIDAAGLATLRGVDESSASAGAVCTVLPPAAVTGATAGPAAAQALARAREVSRWLVLVEAGTLLGAVPTGAR